MTREDLWKISVSLSKILIVARMRVAFHFDFTENARLEKIYKASLFVIFIMSLLNWIECKSSLTQSRISCDTMASSGIPAIDTDVSISAALPSTAGYDINIGPRLTESLALSRVLRGPPQYIQLSSRPVDLPSSVAARWSISPFSLLTGHPNQTSPRNIFALWFPEEPVKGNKRPAPLHLFQLMRRPGPTLGDWKEASAWIWRLGPSSGWTGQIALDVPESPSPAARAGLTCVPGVCVRLRVTSSWHS